MSYEIRKTELFRKKFRKIIPLNKQKDMERRINKLEENPFVGKPLGSRNLRELKLDNFRLYYAVFEREIVVLLLSVSDKKHQQETIDIMREKLPDFMKE